MTGEVRPRERNIRASIQRIGGNLAGMVMPNIGAFIAWGLITALFEPDGWLPNARIAEIVEPMINVLLPVLIGYTGGRLVHGPRGAVVGAVATMGIVVGAGIPMFLGAMIVGPAAAFLVKLFDNSVGDRVPPGFKMLVDNFSAGIIGGAAAVSGMLAIGPAVEAATITLGDGVRALLATNLLPLVSLLIEPAKILFLNNAINHGVLAPLGVTDAAENGKAIHFLLETNPGPGLGILVACLVFGRQAMRATAPAAIVIHFFGGIHEIYFPYVLAAPRLVIAAIAGGATGVLVFSLTDAGLTATPSPGSIIALLAVTPKGGYVGVVGGVVAAACVSFLFAALLLKFGRGNDSAIEQGGAVHRAASHRAR
ncbi:PTS mannose transporter subunit IIA [Kibdelosporangium aridum]|uniref:PTS mannose transporter subunit IIA n=1 Tax=Kibdelosporangium aridum TaxID=2030 RepID=A0A428YK49_KIBAR|nr:PTS mannitol transporter subunit IICB [Kibdelosporangium aridum]RSM67972.1 PTS mannose transporter subunit IIA [Kibdelosporangium aridum]